MENRTMLRRLKCFALSIILAIGFMNVLPAQAAGETKIVFGEVVGKIGGEVTVPITITDNPGIATFRFRISFDMDGLTFVSAEKGNVLTTGTLNAAVDNEKETVTFLWFSPTNVSGDGEIVNLKFQIKDSAKGEYPLGVTYLAEDFLNEKREQVPYTVKEGKILTGSTVGGTVTSFGEANEEVVLKLMSGDTEVATTTSIDGSYQFQSVSPGTYSLVVSKKDHATRTYELTVEKEDITENIKICLLGDVTGDGKVKIGDYSKILAHVRGTATLTGYEFACADVTGDGKVKIGDYSKVLGHVRGTSSLW